MTIQLGHFLAQNEATWDELEKSGLKTGAPFGIEFRLHATKQEAADQILPILQAHGMKIEVKQTRVLMLLKSWSITATEEAQWTLERLQQRTKEIFVEGEKSGAQLNGLGILLPEPARQA